MLEINAKCQFIQKQLVQNPKQGGAGASLGTSKTSAHTVCKKIVYDMKEISRSTRLGLQCQTPI